MNDLAFNLLGYTYILLNDFFTAGMGVVTKKKLDTNALGSLENIQKNKEFQLFRKVFICMAYN